MNQKHISRVETGRTNGWQVRLMRNRIKHSKFFSIKRFGDIDSALAAAVAYRDSLLSIAPPSRQGAVDLSPDAGFRESSTFASMAISGPNSSPEKLVNWALPDCISQSQRKKFPR